MKLEAVMLLAFVCCVSTEGLILITEGEPPRQLANFSCDGHGAIDTAGISKSYFSTNSTGHTTSVFLAKKIDLKNRTDFPLTSGNKCLKQVKVPNVVITFKCDGNSVGTPPVRIMPKHDHDPYICDTSCHTFSNPLELRILENTPVSSVVKNFTFCSDDMNVQSPSIRVAGLLDEHNQVSFVLKQQLDYEKKPPAENLTSTVSIKDKEVLRVNIIIEDEDDLGVAFTNPPYSCSVLENKKGLANDCVVTANDLDKGLHTAVHYSLTSVSPAVQGTFEITNDGILNVKKPLDRENVSSYILLIKAFQVDKPSDNDKLNFTTLQLTVKDIDDNPPELTQARYNASVMENSPIGTIVGQVSATDKDEGENAKNVFSIVDGNKFFEVDNRTGFVKVKSWIDREMKEIHDGGDTIYFQIVAASEHNATIKSENSRMTIQIMDENDNAPKFSESHMSTTINKTQSLSATIIQVSATDPDKLENGTISYKVANANAPFILNNITGVLRLSKSLNESFLSQYQLTIYATDNAVNVDNRRSSFMTLTVNVDDVNIHPPYFFHNMTRRVNISEDAHIGTILLQLKATDTDPTDDLSFTLLDDSDDQFTIEHNKMLKTKRQLDREIKSVYNLTILVNDSIHDVNTTVHIDVTDVNDNTPLFNQANYTFSVTEEENNVVVGTVTATDPDSGENGNVTYFLDKRSPWYNNFSLTTDKSRCTINTNGKIDREQLKHGNNFIYISINARDHGHPPRQNSTSIAIEILDINDHIPQFVANSRTNFTVKENASVHESSYVFQVTATDPDYAGNGTVIYALLPVNHDTPDLFNINETTGVIGLKEKPQVNSCNNSVITLKVEAHNPNSTKNNSIIITCSIQDVNQPPVFTMIRKQASVRETDTPLTKDIDVCPDNRHIFTSHNVPCGSPAASDPDCLESYNKLFYWMDNNDARFKINSSTGIISIKNGSSLDYDSPKLQNIITFKIYATDGLYTATATLKFTIINRSDSLPEFSQETYSCSVNECPETNLHCSLSIRNENDTLMVSQYIYVLTANYSYFGVRKNHKRAEIFLAQCIDYEKIQSDNFLLEVEAHYMRGKESKTRCKVNVTINNINDNPPIFEKKVYNFTIYETYKKGYLFGTINASDADHLEALQYTLEENEYIALNKATLLLDKEPDLDTGRLKSPISLKTFVFDGKHNKSAEILVNVLPVNEYPPEFSKSLYKVKSSENVKGTFTIQVHDNDTGLDGHITTKLSHVPDKWSQNVNLTDTTIHIENFDRDVMGNSSVIQVTVEAQDHGIPPRTGISVVEIKIEGVNDNKPMFQKNEKAVVKYIKEGVSQGEKIFTSKATDEDIGIGSRVFYRFVPEQKEFRIDNTSGIITSAQTLYITGANKGRFDLIVEAYNAENETYTDTQAVTVVLQDINNKIPEFARNSFETTVSECREIGALLLSVTAADADTTAEFNTVTYWLDENYNSTFYMDSKTGKIYLSKKLDFDPPQRQRNISLKVLATDDLENRDKTSNHTANASVSINVTECNDNSPFFDTDQYTCPLPENRDGYFNCTVKATDTDGDNVTYELAIANQNFTVNPNNGSLSAVVKFDYDSMEPKNVLLNVSASDTEHKSYVAVRIQVTDEDDEPPTFLGKPYNFTVHENETNNSFIGSVSVTDKDSKVITLSLANCTDILNVTSRGNILSRGNFDYEKRQEYTCNITATDTSNVVSANVTINVLDVNDNRPVFTSTTCMNKSVSEKTKGGIPICKVSAEDQDKTKAFNTIVYTIFSGNNEGLLEIDNETGTISTAKDLRNSGGKTVTLVVRAADNGEPPLANYTSLTIEIKKENLNPPSFLNTPYKAAVRENQHNVLVFRAIAKDPDGDELTFEVVNATNHFSFQNKSAPVLYTNGLDAEETNGIIYVNINVTDGIYNDSEVVAVTVIDENDNVPYFINNTCNVKMDDTTEDDTLICSVTAEDKDISNSGFTFILSGGKGDIIINRTTGDISLAKRFGHNGKLYTMTAVVVDSGVPPQQNSTVITVDVKETNPSFSYGKDNSIELAENTPSVSASLAVNESIRNITYTIISGNKFSILKTFNFNSDTALLTLANQSNCLDYEKQRKYSFTIFAKDHGVFPKTATADVVINVKDVNESPKITQYDKEIVKEVNTSSGAFISKVVASDPDTNTTFGQLHFTLSDNDNFTVGTDGIITVKAAHLKSGNYTLETTVTDGGNLTDSKQTIVIVPKVNFVPFNGSVNEATQDVIITTFPLHVDGYIVSYSAYSAYCHMDENGTLLLDKELDRESTSSIQIKVLGRDTVHGVLITIRQVNISVIDINDCPPEFLQEQYNITIEDVTKNGTIVARIDVVDRDIDAENRRLTFYSGNDAFSLDSKGDLFYNGSSLSPGVVHFNISVTDGLFTRNATVNIDITDTNDHSPKFTENKYSFTITETNNTNVTVGRTISAHDIDEGGNGAVTFSILNKKELPFRILNMANNSCVIKTTKPIDREAKEIYILNIRASDNGTTPRQSERVVHVNVLDVNDNYPRFSGRAIYSASVKENSKENKSITIDLPSINVTDPDNGINGTAGLVYKLNNSNVPVCIKSTQPTLYVCGEVDREIEDVYNLQITVRDSEGKNGSHSASAPLTIKVIDENDETPRFTEDVYEFSIPENIHSSEIAGNVSATDEDEGERLKYKIESGDDGSFYINAMTGDIYVGGSVDREKQSEYILNISAFDGIHKNFTTVNISITDVNDNAPIFVMSKSGEAITVEIEEGIKDGVIFNATALDDDEAGSSNSEVNYSFTVSPRGFESDLFNLTEDGRLNLTNALDREVLDHYEVNITASDQGNPALSTSLLVLVKVLDINDNRPEICVDGHCNANSSNCYTVEKVPKYSVLKVIESKDIDAGQNATVTYSIEPSDVSKYFKIDNTTGVVVVAEPLVVNNLIHEGFSASDDIVVVNLTIVATDGGGRNSTLTLHVFVEPLNDDDVPIFSESLYKFNISETNNTDVPVGNCSATTNDTNSHMTYEIIGGNAAFDIDPSTGLVKTKVPLDREDIDKYTFAVQVRDGRIPERSAFAAVEVNVDDVNDNSPTFAKDNITITVHENKAILIRKDITADDKDGGINAEMTYGLDNTYGGIFNISEGILTVNGTFDYELRQQYDLVVTAVDRGTPSRNGTAQVHIVVTDENDNWPVFVSSDHAYNVSESEKPNEIFTAYATDEDSGLNGHIIYKLLNSEEVPFDIDTLSGLVYLRGKLDYETQSSYTLNIIAQDLGTPPRSTMNNVTIYVTDVYDDVPAFTQDVYDALVSRTAAVNTSLLNLTVGISKTHFSLTGQDTEFFKITETSGELYLVKPIDDERELYVVQVVVTDILNQSASCKVIVHVTGRQVTFDRPEIKLNLLENLNRTSVLVDLNTTEEFSLTGVVYTIEDIEPAASDRDLFKVNSSTGVVSCTKALNREDVPKYIIYISAHTPDTQNRRKRAVQARSTTIRLVVDVGDVNDNSPRFSSDQERVFGVPDDVRASYRYIVGTVKADDPDISDTGNLQYTAVDGRTDVFGVDEDTGDIVTLVTIANTRTQRFNLVINASDGNIQNEDATINVTILVVPTKNQPYLLVNMTVAEFKKREDDFRRNMSKILGVDVQFERIESHKIRNPAGTQIDLSRTDLILHGINKTTGLLVPNRKMNKLIQDSLSELSTLFGQRPMVNVEMMDTIADPSAITATQILIICMAVFIFFGSLTALIVAQYSWMRYETELQEEEKEDMKVEREIELSTLRSRQSSKLSSVMAVAAVNPGFTETEFVTSNGRLSPEMKAEPQYESQELRVNFQEEPLEGYLNDRNGEVAQSIVDSGVGNTSVHSRNNHLDSSDRSTDGHGGSQAALQVHDGIPVNGEGPVMTSSPRVSRDVRPAEKELTFIEASGDDNRVEGTKFPDISQERKPRGSSFLLLDATGDSETDDTVEDIGNNSGKSGIENNGELNSSHGNADNFGDPNQDEMVDETTKDNGDKSGEVDQKDFENEPNPYVDELKVEDESGDECTSF